MHSHSYRPHITCIGGPTHHRLHPRHLRTKFNKRGCKTPAHHPNLGIISAPCRAFISPTLPQSSSSERRQMVERTPSYTTATKHSQKSAVRGVCTGINDRLFAHILMPTKRAKLKITLSHRCINRCKTCAEGTVFQKGDKAIARGLNASSHKTKRYLH